MKRVIKLRWQTGAHFRCNIFMGHAGYTLANCGELVFTPSEAAEFRQSLRCGIDAGEGTIGGILESGWPEEATE